MKLLTRSLVKKLPAIREINLGKIEKNILYAHFYNPVGKGHWFIMAGESLKDDYLFYGVQLLDGISIGTFTLGELISMKLPFDETIKRDTSFKEMSFKDFNKNLKLFHNGSKS